MSQGGGDARSPACRNPGASPSASEAAGLGFRGRSGLAYAVGARMGGQGASHIPGIGLIVRRRVPQVVWRHREPLQRRVCSEVVERPGLPAWVVRRRAG